MIELTVFRLEHSLVLNGSSMIASRYSWDYPPLEAINCPMDMQFINIVPLATLIEL